MKIRKMKPGIYILAHNKSTFRIVRGDGAKEWRMTQRTGGHLVFEDVATSKSELLRHIPDLCAQQAIV
ncbi:MAG: hypothetical protein WC704_16790 [Sphingomonas sp.]|jgi:hypothetical protein